MSGKYVFSTLTAAHRYPIYAKIPDGGVPRMESFVEIAGGANLADKNLVTHKGKLTTITDEQFEQLQVDPVFKKHVDRGFLLVEDRPGDADEVAKDMTSRDSSAPLTPQDFPDDEQPLVGDPAKAEEPEKPTRKRRGRPRKDS